MEQKDIRLNADLRKGFVKDFRQWSELKPSHWKEEFFKAREDAKSHTKTAFKVVNDLVRRKFPQQDVDTLRKLQKKYDCMDSVANPDSCFYLKVTDKDIKYDEDGDEIESDDSENYPSRHFDFKLNGNVNGSEYSTTMDYAYAMHMEEMKAQGLNPHINIEHKEHTSNPHQSKCVNDNNAYFKDDDVGGSISNKWKEQHAIDIIGSGGCRSRAIPCTQQEFDQMNIWLVSKAKVIQCHEKWISTIIKQVKFFEGQIKMMTKLSKVREFAEKYGWTPSEMLLSKKGTDLVVSTDSMVDVLQNMEGKAPPTRDEKIAVWRKEMADRGQI